jgi:hypothetical protein
MVQVGSPELVVRTMRLPRPKDPEDAWAAGRIRFCISAISCFKDQTQAENNTVMQKATIVFIMTPRPRTLVFYFAHSFPAGFAPKQGASRKKTYFQPLVLPARRPGCGFALVFKKTAPLEGPPFMG